MTDLGKNFISTDDTEFLPPFSIYFEFDFMNE